MPSTAPAVVEPTPSRAPTGARVVAGAGNASACAGGGGESITIVFAAQKLPATTQGAAGFAAAVMRWGNRWPAPSAAEFTAAERNVYTADAAESVRDLRQAYANYRPQYTDEVTTFTPDGRYVIDAVDGDQVQVSVLYRRLTNPAQDESARSTQTVVVRYTNRGWKLVAIGPPKFQDVNVLWDQGTPFSGRDKC